MNISRNCYVLEHANKWVVGELMKNIQATRNIFFLSVKTPLSTPCTQSLRFVTREFHEGQEWNRSLYLMTMQTQCIGFEQWVDPSGKAQLSRKQSSTARLQIIISDISDLNKNEFARL